MRMGSGRHQRCGLVFGEPHKGGRVWKHRRRRQEAVRDVYGIACVGAVHGMSGALRAKSGRVAVFCDRWSVHRSAAVAEYLAGHPDVRLIMLPKGSPYLNVVEECWNLGKPIVFSGIVYRKISELRHAISEYYRTASLARLCMYRYIYRSPVKALNYL